ncbi:DUF742 domain-containing protein [Streptomyces millisiae]|uniref:DUF742 domain-containing protein n=1 Tax=Streptomyces millisiae TaxID=3075542 RepID=A0ABU2LL47_9ACTN|nr:DUF742 domain-containing protein [Streptomyces sp. DSM 44918]MDT0317967.1 DUF742 domain-containing protein [Streptomyces sp. DSM 44918]
MTEGRRRTRPWGPLRGTSDEDNELARHLRSWLDHADLALNDLMGELRPEHFRDGRVPGRTTVSDRLAGVRLTWDFVEAVADVCSRTEVERARLLSEARACGKRPAGTERGASAGDTGATRDVGGPRGADVADSAAELVAVQRQSLALSDKLVRAVERAVELERARSEASQIVWLLLAMVDELQRRVSSLQAERGRLLTAGTGKNELRLRERLRRSEDQRRQAESELRRASAERDRADELAERAAAQVRALTEELECLRRKADPHQVPATLPGPQHPAREITDTAADDIDRALATAARRLDDGEDRLTRLADELREDADDSDIPGQGREWADIPPDNPLPGLHAPSTDIPRLVRDARAAERHHEAHRLLTGVGRDDSPPKVLEVVSALRDAGQEADAYQVLAAVGRVRASADIPSFLRSVRRASDAEWVLATAARERGPDALTELVKALRGDNQRQAADTLKTLLVQRLRTPVPQNPREWTKADRHNPRFSLRARGEDAPEGNQASLVRPYAPAVPKQVTHHPPLDNAVVDTTQIGEQAWNLLPEQQRICDLCRRPTSVAHISMQLSIPLGVTRLLVSDLCAAGLVTIRQPGDRAMGTVSVAWEDGPFGPMPSPFG